MRSTNSFYYMLLILVLTMGMMYCGSDGSGNENTDTADSTTLNTDSAMDAHNRDPSTAYPQPPVSGTNQDSSRTKDSANKQ